MVAHGGLSPACNEAPQDRAGVQTPSQTRVSLGQADPHENSGVWKQMQRTAVEIGVQTVGMETLVTEADLEFDLEWDLARDAGDGSDRRGSEAQVAAVVGQVLRTVALI